MACNSTHLIYDHDTNCHCRRQFSAYQSRGARTIESDGKELALVDPREEGVFGKAHLLHAVNLPLSKLELNVFRMIPRKSTRIVLTDAGDGLSERAAVKLKEFGYTILRFLRAAILPGKRLGMRFSAA